MLDKIYLGEFVTAKMATDEPHDIRQGWVTNIFDKDDLFIIKGQTGNIYACKGVPKIVENPPDDIWGINKNKS